MLLHRPFATGLFGMVVCFALSLGAAPELPEVPAAAELVEPAPRDEVLAKLPRAAPAVSVVDMAAAAATPALVAEVIRLGADERVTAVDDRAVDSDLAAGARIAARFQHEAIGAGGFLDVAIAGGAGARRVLVLFH
jgi:hypothetical protein